MSIHSDDLADVDYYLVFGTKLWGNVSFKKAALLHVA